MLLFSFPLWWCWLFHKEMNWLQAKGVYKNGHNESNGVNAQYLPGPTLLLFVEGGGSGRVWRLMTATVRWTSCEHDGLMFSFFFCSSVFQDKKNPGAVPLRNSKKTKNQKTSAMFACLSAQSPLTMWMKSTGVAVYKSQCSLSRMILSMRRISAVEKLQPLCITRSLTEPITCSNTHRQKREVNKTRCFQLTPPTCSSLYFFLRFIFWWYDITDKILPRLPRWFWQRGPARWRRCTSGILAAPENMKHLVSID